MMAIRGARVTRWRTAALRIALEIALLAVVATVYGACSVPSFGFRDEAIVSDGGPGSDVSDAAPPNHCLDQIQDQDETGTDCGGSCTPCAPGLGCIQNTDCDSSVCEGGSCSQPTCSDGVLNGDETERDCGGSRCPKCAPGQACKVDTDCVSSSCQAHLCALSCLPGQGDCDGDITNGCEANLQTDALHCGDCATPCILAHASAACSGGKCLVDECSAPYADCDGDPTNGCETNTDTDPDSCGRCGMGCVALNGTPSCSAGACQITCNVGFADCDDSRANGCEIDLTKDTSHCSACDVTCSEVGGTANCVDGTCGIANCQAGLGDCDGTDSCQQNLTNDVNNCGACGKACLVANGAGACVGSSCKVASCSTGYADCNAGSAGGYADGCEVNTASDPNNCGKCGNVCSVANGSAKCVAGKCVVKTCTPPFEDCAGTGLGCATDTSLDGANCGGCGTSCNAEFGPLHAAGKCQTSACVLDQCNTGFADCNKQAVDGCESNQTSDANNCGGCGSACLAPHGSNSCVASKCAPSCGTAFGNCDGIVANGCEVAFATDKKNCGMCGTTCLDNNTSSNNCSAGVCAPMCNAGFQSCDSNVINGCESNQGNDAANCGGCGTACSNLHGTTLCNGGACSPSCATGFSDCDSDPNNGCEKATSADSANCGGCGVACKTTNASGSTCATSACKPVCNDGWAACSNPQNGCTTSLDSASDCGTCGNLCPAANPFCIARMCQQRLNIKVVNSGTTGTSTSNTSLVMSHALATPSGNYRVLVVGVVNYGTGALAARYNNVSMTLAKSAVTAQVWGGVFYLADSALPAAAGTYSITVTGGSFGIVGEAMELTGVDQTTPLDSATSSVRSDGTCVSQSDTLNVLSDASLMYGLVAEYASAGDAGTPSGSETQVMDLRSTAMGALAGYQTPVTTGSHTFPWSVNAGCVSTGGVLIALRPAVTP
jgi:hypothetical protein